MSTIFADAIEKTLRRLGEHCSQKGGQLTDIRRLILGLLLKTGQPVKAYDLIEEAGRLGRKMTPTTIYRALDFLIDNGLVHKVNALNAYVACTEQSVPLVHEPLLLVCPDCRKTSEINDPDLMDSIFAKLESLGFSISGGSIEVHGQCRSCSSK
ncbi:MAG: transcriptional repressor [Deltaproteobacteria bacterium]|nr:transcriptional repressor [Deltaproteobacteria bacterium]